MDYSIVTAQFLGIVFVFYGLALLLNGKKFKAARESVKNCAGLSWMIGVCQLFWGSFLIVTQEEWMGWMILTTIAGWAIFLMGIARLWCCPCPDTCGIDQKCDTANTCDTKKCSRSCCVTSMGIIGIVWGLAMVYTGFFDADMNNVINIVHHVILGL